MYFFADQYFRLTNYVKRFRNKRYIRLSEHLPGRAGFIVPISEQLDNSDGLVKKRYAFRVDSNGFIFPSEINPHPDLKLVFIGGSSTECAFMEELNRFPYKVGRIIEDKINRKVNSYNAGVSYNNSFHTMNILLNKIIPLRPDVVVIMHAINEVNAFLFENGYWGTDPFWPREITSPFSKKKKQVALKPKDKHEFRNELVAFMNEFHSNLKTVISICREKKITAVLMTEANRLTSAPHSTINNSIKKSLGKIGGIDYSSYKEIYDQVNQVVRNVGSEEGALVIDLANKIPQSDRYMYDVVHYNDFGSQFAANIIAGELIELLVYPSDKRV